MKRFYLLILLIISFNAQAQKALYNFNSGSNKDFYGVYDGVFYGNSKQSNGLLIGYNTNDYFEIPSVVLNNKLAFTIEFDVKFNQLNLLDAYPTNTLFAGSSEINSSTFAFSYQKNINSWRLFFNEKLFDFYDDKIVSNKWYHVSLKRDMNGNINLVVDNIQSSSKYNDLSIITMTNFLVGQETDCFAGCFAVNQSANAYFDNIRINDVDYNYISGTVHQQSDFLAFGEVQALNIDDNSTYSAFTDQNGNFKFDSLPTANYKIKAIQSGNGSFLTTYYPNSTDFQHAEELTLVDSIESVDIYMESNENIFNLNSLDMIKVIPNPFNDQLNLKLLLSNSKNVIISLMDSFGHTVLEFNTNNIEKSIIDTSNLKIGMYFLKVTIDSNVKIISVLKM